MKTFIEIWHEDRESFTNWFATKSVTRWKGDSFSMSEGWRVGGSELHVYDKEDIAALRTLLDAIEKEFDENSN